MNHNVKAQPADHLPPCSRIWMGYFLITIAVIGFPLGFGICVPLYLFGRVLPRAQMRIDWVVRWGIERLIRVQPWLDIDADLELPDSGVLLVANHRSHLDAFLLLAKVRGIRMLAKRSLFYIPFLGAMMRVTGQIPTQRGRIDSFWKAMELARKKLEQGQTVLVFPEMTRCIEGASGTRSFMLAPFLMAKESSAPVVPLVIRGTDRVWPRGTFGLRTKQKVQIQTLPALDPREYASAEELCRAARARIDEALA
jgi:1-acyl-sn-glycerol-3-phosphate acyltransferase